LSLPRLGAYKVAREAGVRQPGRLPGRVASRVMSEVLDGPDKDVPAIRRQLRTPRAAGFAGLVFSVLLVVALVLVQVAIRATPKDGGVWLTDKTHRQAVLAALGLMPFAAIAFLSFIGVVRDHIGDQEDRFFATVFLGSGVLFLAMLLVAAALAGASSKARTRTASWLPAEAGISRATRPTR